MGDGWRQQLYLLHLGDELELNDIGYIDRNDFIAFIEDVNKDYKFCVVDMTSQSNDPANFLLLVKARPPKEVKKTDEATQN